jgi:hypothetical protein
VTRVWDIRDTAATVLYVEARIVFIGQPDVRLYTRWNPQRAAAVLYGDGIWHGYYGAAPMYEPSFVEVWAEGLLTGAPEAEPRVVARYAAEEMYRAIDTAYRNRNTWGRVTA